MKKDKITVVVPVYNVEKYLERCIDSIINQTYKNLEILLVYDVSKDNSVNICKKYAKKYKKFIKLFHNNNAETGLSFARNLGIKKATGKYICFIDSDDYIEPDYVQRMYDKIIKDNTDFVICNYKRIYKKSVQYCNVSNFEIDNFLNPGAWNKLYKIGVFSKVKFPNKKIYYEDLDTIPKIIMNKVKYSFVEEYLYNYVQNNESGMHKSTDKIFDIYDIMESNVNYAKRNSVYEKYKNNLELAYIFHILIGTTYRARNHENFSINMINNIYKHVVSIFPKWYKNKGIKRLNICYRMFLLLYRFKLFCLIYILLKIFGKFIYKYK